LLYEFIPILIGPRASIYEWLPIALWGLSAGLVDCRTVEWGGGAFDSESESDAEPNEVRSVVKLEVLLLVPRFH